MSNTNCRIGAVVAFLAICSSGCGNGKVVHKVSGKVTFESKPIQQGEIRFSNAGNADEAGQIKDGNYTTALAEGNWKVRIFAYREKPGQIVVPVTGTAPLMENYIPAKYNDKSELVAEITEPTEDVNFDLMGSSE